MAEPHGERRMELFDGLLGLFHPGRLVDLGAGHGKFARRAVSAGWTVTAVDARSERWPDDPRITWVHQDVREADLTGYDLILCLGLWYHLTLDDQLDLLKRASGTPMIIDTQLATNAPTQPLSEPVTLRGYRGRYFREHLEAPTASWGNELSFWPRPKAFYRMLREHGYPTVYAGVPWITTSRTFFLCLPARESRRRVRA